MVKLWCTFFSSLGGENAGYDRKDGSWGIWALPFVNYPHSKWNKRRVLFIFAFWFQLLLYLVSFCLFLLASLRFLNRGYQGGSCLSQNCLALPMLLCRFGELSAITNIGRTGRRARSEKNSVGWKCPNYFCLRLRLFHSTLPSKSTPLPPPPPSFCFPGQVEPVVGSFSAREISRLPHK